MSATRTSPRLRMATMSALFMIAITCLTGTEPAAAQKHHGRSASPSQTDPYAAIISAGDTIHWLSVAPFTVRMMLGPKEARKEVSPPAILKLVDPATNMYAVTIEHPEIGTTRLVVRVTNAGHTATDDRFLVVEQPLLRTARFQGGQMVSSGIDSWGALDAVIGEVYDPSSAIFANTGIPATHYQTIVTIKGQQVINRPGLRFTNQPDALKRQLTITEGSKPEDIVTKVYWRPGGTADTAQWKLLLCNQFNSGVAIPLERRPMHLAYRPPELVAERFAFSAARFDRRHRTWESPTFETFQNVGGERRDVELFIACEQCSNYGIEISLRDTVAAPADGPPQVLRSKKYLQMRVTDFDRLVARYAQPDAGLLRFSLELKGSGEPIEEQMSLHFTVEDR